MGEIEVIQGDCREILPTLQGVSAIVSDPPYGINFVKGDSGRGVNGRPAPRRNAGPISGDSEPFDPSHLLHWPCVLFGADHYADKLPPGGSFHAWDKKAHCTLDDSFSDVEFIWTSWKCKARIVTHLWKGVLRESGANTPKYHVSQKPIPVMVKLLDWFTKPGDLICDPYGGSGSTAVACLKTGRRCIIIESDSRHCETIRRRVRDAATPLFPAQEANDP